MADRVAMPVPTWAARLHFEGQRVGYGTDTNAWQSFLKLAAPRIPEGWDVLEMGPGKVRRSVVRKWALGRGLNYHFADLHNRYDRVPGFVKMLGEESIDAEDDRFDCVICFQMTHNVKRLWRWLPEVARVVRVGGLVVIVAPITWLTNRYPIDFGRIFPDGWTTLFTDAGLVAELMELSSLDRSEAGRKHQTGRAYVTDIVAIGRKL